MSPSQYFFLFLPVFLLFPLKTNTNMATPAASGSYSLRAWLLPPWRYRLSWQTAESCCSLGSSWFSFLSPSLFLLNLKVSLLSLLFIKLMYVSHSIKFWRVKSKDPKTTEIICVTFLLYSQKQISAPAIPTCMALGYFFSWVCSLIC